MALIRVVLQRRRLVASTEPHEVGGDAPVTRTNERRDHRPVEIAPARLAVHQQDRRSVLRAFIEVVDPDPFHVDVVRGERIPLKSIESVIRGSQDVHLEQPPRAAGSGQSNGRAMSDARPGPSSKPMKL